MLWGIGEGLSAYARARQRNRELELALQEVARQQKQQEFANQLMLRKQAEEESANRATREYQTKQLGLAEQRLGMEYPQNRPPTIEEMLAIASDPNAMAALAASPAAREAANKRFGPLLGGATQQVQVPQPYRPVTTTTAPPPQPGPSPLPGIGLPERPSQPPWMPQATPPAPTPTTTTSWVPQPPRTETRPAELIPAGYKRPAGAGELTQRARTLGDIFRMIPGEVISALDEQGQIKFATAAGNLFGVDTQEALGLLREQTRTEVEGEKQAGLKTTAMELANDNVELKNQLLHKDVDWYDVMHQSALNYEKARAGAAGRTGRGGGRGGGRGADPDMMQLRSLTLLALQEARDTDDLVRLGDSILYMSEQIKALKPGPLRDAYVMQRDLALQTQNKIRERSGGQQTVPLPGPGGANITLNVGAPPPTGRKAGPPPTRFKVAGNNTVVEGYSAKYSKKSPEEIADAMIAHEPRAKNWNRATIISVIRAHRTRRKR